MSRWIVLGVWVTVAFLAALFYGQLNFSARSLPQEYKVGVVLKAMDSEYWLAVRSRMENTAREKGMRLIVMAPENEAAYAEQEQIVRDLLAADVDALVIAPVDIDRADVYVGMAAERAVPLLTIDEKITNVPYIGSDNYTIGQMAAAYMAEHIPEGGRSAFLRGSRSRTRIDSASQAFGTMCESMAVCASLQLQWMQHSIGRRRCRRSA